MSDKKTGFNYVDFSKTPKKIFEFILFLLKIVAVAALVVVVAAFMVVPAIATKDPAKIIEPAMKIKGLIFRK